MDELDYGDEELRNFNNDGTEKHVQNGKKLNCHSYMNKQTQAKWTKSDTDLFYKVLFFFKKALGLLSSFHIISNLLHRYFCLHVSIDAHSIRVFALIMVQGLQQFGSNFAIIQQLIPGETRHQVRAKFKIEEKKNPLQVHDAIVHRSVGATLQNY